MAVEEWEELNVKYHSSHQGKDECSDDVRWLERLQEQAAIITRLAQLGVLPKALPWVDWGCGDGKLAHLLEGNQLCTLKYDRYMRHGNDYLTDSELQNKKYSVVFNTSIFEHLRDLETLNSINRLVSEDGVLAIHTLVTEAIPSDPQWFYLLPVHCSFFTNKGMQILFDAWGYEVSIYHVPSRMWFWFKKRGDFVKKMFALGHLHRKECFYFKDGFMNYWGVDNFK
jgi:Methyltransferase domain